MLTLTEVYNLKSAYYTKNPNNSFKPSWSEDGNIIYYTHPNQTDDVTETALPPAVEWRKRDILLTKWEDQEEEKTTPHDKQYYVYFRSVTGNEEVNRAKYLLRKDYPYFLVLRQGIPLPSGDHRNAWEPEDELFFTEHLQKQIEDHLLYLPENRLRFVTGEIKRSIY